MKSIWAVGGFNNSLDNIITCILLFKPKRFQLENTYFSDNVTFQQFTFTYNSFEFMSVLNKYNLYSKQLATL